MSVYCAIWTMRAAIACRVSVACQTCSEEEARAGIAHHDFNNKR